MARRFVHDQKPVDHRIETALPSNPPFATAIVANEDRILFPGIMLRFHQPLLTAPARP